MNLSVILLILASTFLAALGSVYLKKGAGKLELNLKTLLNKSLIAGVILFIISTGFYVWALKMEKLSHVYPSTSLTYVWVILLSRFMLGEKINKEKVIGVGFIILGILILTGV